MFNDSKAINESASLAAAVRILAHDVHRLMASRAQGGPGGDNREVCALLQRVDRARRQVRGRRADDLSRWLDSLHRQVLQLQRPVVREAQPLGPA